MIRNFSHPHFPTITHPHLIPFQLSPWAYPCSETSTMSCLHLKWKLIEAGPFILHPSSQHESYCTLNSCLITNNPEMESKPNICDHQSSQGISGDERYKSVIFIYFKCLALCKHPSHKLSEFHISWKKKRIRLADTYSKIAKTKNPWTEFQKCSFWWGTGKKGHMLEVKSAVEDNRELRNAVLYLSAYFILVYFIYSGCGSCEF